MESDTFIILKMSEECHFNLSVLWKEGFYEKRRFRKNDKYDIIQNSMIY